MRVNACDAIDCLVGKADVQVGRRCPFGEGAQLKVVYARKHFGDFADDYLKLKRRLARLLIHERY
jgi:hypothetical protein